MHLVSRRLVAIGLGLIGLSPAASASAQEASKPEPARKDQKAAQRVEGVIVTVKPFAILASEASKLEADEAEGKEPKTRYELTINTLIPWADYVRDEAVNPADVGGAGETPAEKAKPAIVPKTKQSVATEGHPKDSPGQTRVSLTPGTKIELRYRSSTDESDDGAPTVEAAEALNRDPADKAKSDSADVKPLALRAKDLRVGQYVIVEYTKSPGQEPATKIIILKPIGGSDTSAKDDEAEKPANK